MNSNMSAGERRWGSARRGGMTVLGKVAVPKPINLPSQRLENHGLDPNVAIVPKGTVSWGSRSSSSASNPWVSLSLSPNADGGTVSPSHLSGRPSSGGSGTRPSTAGSDRTHETAGNAWGSNSRPSSASGTLSSNQTSSTSLRPRSAENRPNSSQLSRFAEPASKSSVAWGPSNTAERLGVKSPKEDVFSLSSGDFPTLGSEKDCSVKNIDTEDRDRPSSASGRIAQIKEDAKSQADLKHGLNTWRADGSRSTEDDIHPCMEKWQGESHQYFNANPAPQHFDAWHGPPVNGPAGVWYGGRPRAPAFGPPVPPRGFPMEQFPYYRPQMPPPPLAGSQPVPPPGAGPRGPCPKNGDLYRPQVPDAYARPGMPFRPGFYPGPPGPPGPMAFEGYYGPPMGYCNNDRDLPYMGMAAGPPVYQGYASPRPDVGNSRGRSAGRTVGKTLSGQMEAEHLEDTRRPKRAPLKKHNEYESYDDQREEGENQETNRQPNISYSGKSQLPIMSSQRNEWGAEVDAEEAIFSKRATPNENFLHSSEYQIHSADSTKVKSFEGTGNVKAINDNWTSKSEGIPSFPPDMRPLANEKDSSVPAVTKNSVLMHKIDGLNAKIRVSDGRNDVSSAYNRDEQRDRTRIPDMKFNNCTGEFSNSVECFERTPVSREFISVSREEVIVPADEKPIQSMSLVSRSNISTKRLSHSSQGRVDHHGKGKLSNQNADGWKRKPNTESASAVITSNIESAPNFHARGPNIVVEASENSSVETYDSTDVQRAKKRELAKQRALQLQKEEEERTREQKAKALAKLEELDRRQLAGDAANQKADRTQATADAQIKQEESPVLGESMVADLKFQVPALDQVSKPGVTSFDKDNNANSTGKSVEVSRNLPEEMEQTGLLESNVYPLPVHEDARDGSAKRAVSQFNDGGLSRHKRTGYKLKQNNTLQKSFNETVSSGPSESNIVQPHVATIDNKSLGPSSEIKMSETNVANASNVAEPLSGHQRRKSNRTGKNKHKVDENPATPALPPVQSDTNPGKDSIGTCESKDSLSNMDNAVSTVVEPDRGVQAKEVCSSLPHEESQGRASNQWKPQPSHRLPRNQQANRSMDKLHGSDTVVWAPVRTQVKAKGSVDASQNSIHESSNSIKGDNMAQNSSKGKRAEMERYVPKPVAKELAQQGSIPTLSSSTSSSRSNEDPGREQSGSAIPQHVIPVAAYFGSGVESNEGDGNHKHKNDHGTWRQRGSTDSSHMKGVHLVAAPTSEPTKDNQQAKEPVQLVKSEISSASAENRTSGRGKRHLPKGTRSTGNNPDPKNAVGGEIDGICNQSAAPDVNQMDRGVVLKESRSFGERMSSQWQPKSHPHPVNNQNGNRNAGSQSVTAEINRLPRKDNPQHNAKVTLHHDKDTGNDTQPYPGQSVNVKRSVAESNVGHLQELEKEKKPAPVKGHPSSPNQDPVGFSELAPTHNTDDQIEHNIPSGFRRSARQNSRPGRGHESRGDWSGGYDTRPHSIPSFQDRQRQNVHYEYQPVGSFKSNKLEKVEEPADGGGGENMDQRHRGRGQGYSKRGGNIYRRRTGTAHIDSGRD